MGQAPQNLKDLNSPLLIEVRKKLRETLKFEAVGIVPILLVDSGRRRQQIAYYISILCPCNSGLASKTEA